MKNNTPSIRSYITTITTGRTSLDIAAVLVFCLLILSNPSTCLAQEEDKDYFPLAIGYSWKYKITELNEDITMKVTQKCKVGTSESFGVETLRAGSPVGTTLFFTRIPGKILMVGCLDPLDNKIAEFITPIEYIRTPLKVGTTWSWTEKTQDNSGKTYTQTMKVLKNEIISVPAGMFPTRRILHEYTQEGVAMKKNLWYAPDVGLVKWTVEDGKTRIVVVLMEFRKKS